MSADGWKVAVGADETTAVYEPPTPTSEGGAERAVYVCAHGAGGSMSDRGMLASANALRGRGIGVVRYNFVYSEKKSGRPDRMPKLMETVTAVVDRVRTELRPRRLIIGGRSMGGRASSMLASEGFAADGLLLLAYPLHPAGAPEKLRVEHLPQIRMPVLFLSGTRDALCTPELMERAVATMIAPVDMHWVDGADHSFHVLKSSGRTDGQVLDEIAEASSRWVDKL
ncbi:MAG: dienelactone hydrolase family protein [Gemmatimonadota bacterium]|nr:dienelactone hydrolase family protein [Gemmatimonadota bacterium]